MDTENNKFKAAWKLNNVPLLAERFKWQTYVSDYFEEFPWTNTGMLCNHNFHLHMKKNICSLHEATTSFLWNLLCLTSNEDKYGGRLSWQKPNWPQFAHLNSTNFCVCVKYALFNFWKQTWDYLLMKLNPTTFLGIFCTNTLRLFVISDFFIFSDCSDTLPLSLLFL